MRAVEVAVLPPHVPATNCTTKFVIECFWPKFSWNFEIRGRFNQPLIENSRTTNSRFSFKVRLVNPCSATFSKDFATFLEREKISREFFCTKITIADFCLIVFLYCPRSARDFHNVAIHTIYCCTNPRTLKNSSNSRKTIKTQFTSFHFI